MSFKCKSNSELCSELVKNSPSKYQLQYLIVLLKTRLSTTIGNDVF